MKIKMYLAGLVILAATGMAASAQTLRNASFEELETDRDNPAAVLAASWGRWGNWFDRESSFDDALSGDCAMVYHHEETSQTDSSGIFQDISGVEPGSECTFSIQARTDTAQLNIQSIELRLEKQGGFETYASQSYSTDELSSAAWSRLAVTGRVKEEGVRVLVIVYPAGGAERKGIVIFDDAEIEVYD
jgi:hypothetical protein